MTNQEPLLINQRQAAKLLSISERTLYSLRVSGRIKAVRIGIGGWRYSMDELRRFISDSEKENGRDGVDFK